MLVRLEALALALAAAGGPIVIAIVGLLNGVAHLVQRVRSFGWRSLFNKSEDIKK